MQDSRSKDVTRPTFYFLNVLQLVWIVWNALCMSSTFVLGEVPFLYTSLLVTATTLTCACFPLKLVALLPGSHPIERVVVMILIGKVIFDSTFCIVIIGSTDTQFGLHFYYDLPLVTTTMSALDVVLFPHFVASAHEESLRKQK
nr:unnamed protein product [Haemonchus contortus]